MLPGWKCSLHLRWHQTPLTVSKPCYQHFSWFAFGLHRNIVLLCFVFFKQAHFPGRVQTWRQRRQIYTPCTQDLGHIQCSHAVKTWRLTVKLSHSTCHDMWIMSRASRPSSNSHQVNQMQTLPCMAWQFSTTSTRLTFSSWWQWGRHWRGRNRPAAVMFACKRCCCPQMQSVPLFLPSTWRMRPGGKARGA